MAIQAIALLRIPRSALPLGDAARVDALEDAVLVYTEESFAREPVELSLALHQRIGDALGAHQDPRGIFFIPDVAAPKARSYDAVLEEIGEGGVWAPLVDDADAPGEGDFGALLGNLLGQMPSSLLAAANAAAQGQPGAFEAVSSQLQGMLNNSSELAGLAAQFAGMLGQPGAAGGPTQVPHERAAAPSEEAMSSELAEMAELLTKSGIDLSDPSLRALTAKMESAFAHELAPTKAAPDKGEGDK